MMERKGTEPATRLETIAEVRLWQAVIVSTIRDWKSGSLRLKRQADQYLFQDEIDFPVVCQAAGIDLGQLRAKLMKLRG